MKIFFDHSENEATNITTFYFNSEEPFYYTAGQYAEFTLEHPNADNRGEKRWFTLSSSPTDHFISVTNKFTDSGGSSFKTALRNLKRGDVLSLGEPRGNFVLPKDVNVPLVFVAGGMGITPFHSMLSWLSAVGEERIIKLFYGAHTEEEMILKPALMKAIQQTTIVISEPSLITVDKHGYLTAELILGSEKLAKDARIYISGPERLVTNLEKDLRGAGVQEEQLVLDSIPGYSNV